MNAKHEALKQKIKERLEESRHIPTAREKQIEERNTPYKPTSVHAISWKTRHERRHGQGKKTTKSEALEHFKTMSKDYGKIKQ